ncbi:hypothetical protein M427DRAFT_57075 [Gonapodya prolifera JEL478]|uniref:Zn(2)-C6 fungal-type domain-containing protein n=1 Tax=Gonapodya prolifera (strain JEL478) TaxID=1344416 RepID=A0A139ADS9_GONPJ|nr:hypothetical protein M427DRAFT_57075 [Gonapodya prolifera JEL478]|eukprot:KXS14927.1 hypothetical protein M427DRAFT_57075 [Gonapodya prolifera JEL478]
MPPKPKTACVKCKKDRVKCSGGNPCDRCYNTGIPCRRQSDSPQTPAPSDDGSPSPQRGPSPNETYKTEVLPEQDTKIENLSPKSSPSFGSEVAIQPAFPHPQTSIGIFGGLTSLPGENGLRGLLFRYFQLAEEIDTWVVHRFLPQPDMFRGDDATDSILVYGMLALASQFSSRGDVKRPLIEGMTGTNRDGLPFFERGLQLTSMIQNARNPGMRELTALMHLLLVLSSNFHTNMLTTLAVLSILVELLFKVGLHVDPDDCPELRKRPVKEKESRRMIFWLIYAHERNTLCHYTIPYTSAFGDLVVLGKENPTPPHFPGIRSPPWPDNPTAEGPRASEFFVLDPVKAREMFVGGRVPDTALMPFAAFVAGQISLFWIDLKTQFLPIRCGDPFRRPTSKCPPGCVHNRMELLDACCQVVEEAFPEDLKGDVLQTGQGRFAYRVDAWPLKPHFKTEDAPEKVFVSGPTFWIFDFFCSWMILHGPKPGSVVLLSESAAVSAAPVHATQADQTATHCPLSWLHEEEGYTKCLGIAGKFLCLLEAFVNSDWRERGGVVMVTGIYAVYLCALMHVLSYRNLKFLTHGSSRDDTLPLSTCSAEQLGVLASRARDLAMLSICALELTGKVHLAGKELAALCKLYMVEERHGGITPSWRSFDQGELRRTLQVLAPWAKHS